MNNLDGGTVTPPDANPTSYTCKDEFTLTNPEKEGYTFIGWTEKGIPGEPKKTVTVMEGSIGNQKFIANWTPTVITNLPMTFEMFTGQNVTWTPNPEGGTWKWDGEFFSALVDGSATFTARKPGTTTITYTVNGVSKSVTVTIHQVVQPETGYDNNTWIWILASLAAACGAGMVLICIRKNTKSCEGEV